MRSRLQKVITEADGFVHGSVIRMARTILQGWRRYKNHPDRRIRRRFAWDAEELPVTFAGALWAAKRWFRTNPELTAKISGILKDIHREFGVRSRLIAPLVGRYLRIKLSREDRRLRKGWTYEPPTFYETNELHAAPVRSRRGREHRN